MNNCNADFFGGLAAGLGFLVFGMIFLYVLVNNGDKK
jgi:hypothetical protein